MRSFLTKDDKIETLPDEQTFTSVLRIIILITGSKCTVIDVCDSGGISSLCFTLSEYNIPPSRIVTFSEKKDLLSHISKLSSWEEKKETKQHSLKESSIDSGPWKRINWDLFYREANENVLIYVNIDWNQDIGYKADTIVNEIKNIETQAKRIGFKKFFILLKIPISSFERVHRFSKEKAKEIKQQQGGVEKPYAFEGAPYIPRFFSFKDVPEVRANTVLSYLLDSLSEMKIVYQITNLVNRDFYVLIQSSNEGQEPSQFESLPDDIKNTYEVESYEPRQDKRVYLIKPPPPTVEEEENILMDIKPISRKEWKKRNKQFNRRNTPWNQRKYKIREIGHNEYLRGLYEKLDQLEKDLEISTKQEKSIIKTKIKGINEQIRLEQKKTREEKEIEIQTEEEKKKREEAENRRLKQETLSEIKEGKEEEEKEKDMEALNQKEKARIQKRISESKYRYEKDEDLDKPLPTISATERKIMRKKPEEPNPKLPPPPPPKKEEKKEKKEEKKKKKEEEEEEDMLTALYSNKKEDKTSSGFLKRWNADGSESKVKRVGHYDRSYYDTTKMITDFSLDKINPWFKFNGCPLLTTEIKSNLEERGLVPSLIELDLSYTNAFALAKDIRILFGTKGVKEIRCLEVLPKFGSTTLALFGALGKTKMPDALLVSDVYQDERSTLDFRDIMLGTLGYEQESYFDETRQFYRKYNVIYVNMSFPKSPPEDLKTLFYSTGITFRPQDKESDLITIAEEALRKGSGWDYKVKKQVSRALRTIKYTRAQWDRVAVYVSRIEEEDKKGEEDKKNYVKRILCFPVPRFRVSKPNTGYQYNPKDQTRRVPVVTEGVVPFREGTMMKDLEPLVNIILTHKSKLKLFVSIFGAFYFVYVLVFNGNNFPEFLKFTMGSRCFNRRYSYFDADSSKFVDL